MEGESRRLRGWKGVRGKSEGWKGVLQQNWSRSICTGERNTAEAVQWLPATRSELDPTAETSQHLTLPHHRLLEHIPRVLIRIS